MKQIKVKLPLWRVKAAAPKARCIKGEPYNTDTFAKVYYLGGGWWLLSGYHWRGDDVDADLRAMRVTSLWDYEITDLDDLDF